MKINYLSFFKENKYIPGYFEGLNNLMGTGVVYAGTNCANKPIGGDRNGYCWTLSFSRDYAVQLFFSQYGTQTIYFRQKTGGNWGEWTER